MAIKLSSLTLSRRIPNWACLNAHLSSISCAINLQSTQESEQSQSNSAEFEAKIQFLKNRLHPDSLVSVLERTSDLNSSVKLFKWASLQKTFNHTADTYHMMILKLGMAGNVEEMEGFCHEMVREKCRGFDKSLLALIDSFVGNHRLSEALRVLYVMNSSSFKPSIGIINALMSALVEEKRDFKDVLFVYKEMVKAGICPDIDTLNYLLEALFESGRVDTAIDQYRRMDKKGCNPNIRTFEILISGLAARNRVEQSIGILQEMFECGCELDSRFYTRIIPIFCGLQNLEIGSRLFKLMRASNIAPDSVTYGAMIRCLCEHLQMDDAIKLFKEMTDSSLLPDHQVYVDIINGLCKLNKITEARNLLEERNLMDTCLHNSILASYCNSGNFILAKDMFRDMLGRSIIDASSWNILIRFLCENLVINKASEYVCRMVISSFVPDSATYSALILGNCKTGKVADALYLFGHIKSKYWVLDSVSYAEFVECLCQRGNIQDAAKVFCYMCDKGCTLQLTSFNMLIEKICASGEVNRAIKLLSLAYSTDVVASLGASYNNILRGLSRLGQENYLWMMLAQMIVIGCALDAETYCILIQCMSALDHIGDCVFVFNLMLREDLIPDSETLGCLLSCLAKYSQMHLIFPSIDKLVSMPEILDSTMYSVLIDSLWREGYRSEASHLLDLMLEKGWVPDASTHALLIGSIARKEMVGRKSGSEIFSIQDNVSCILEEGLGKR
ncbi:pentatricopeptide repeat-containing protein At5g64320, mitochondrial-like [Sesamum indicum]|uniref:Pentatricopeptide repeat-containing protein At5g64320, mitochondrial-like n=1 Tax=Sesamum indicum TaxID=4182 RepID=A0A6I9TNH2_SESIN|nr:pentatricopeptide repeat-containing protein At5g64320, mitochondrial-like [Sesamum indicum]